MTNDRKRRRRGGEVWLLRKERRSESVRSSFYRPC